MAAMRRANRYASDDPYAKNRRAMWFGAGKRQRHIPWAKIWLPAAIFILGIIVWAIREPKEQWPPPETPQQSVERR